VTVDPRDNPNVVTLLADMGVKLTGIFVELGPWWVAKGIWTGTDEHCLISCNEKGKLSVYVDWDDRDL
jgi:hypothetical protein